MAVFGLKLATSKGQNVPNLAEMGQDGMSLMKYNKIRPFKWDYESKIEPKHGLLFAGNA